MWFSRENCFHLSYLKHREIHVWQTLDFLGTLETAQTKKAENNHSGGGGRGGGAKDECTKNSSRLRPNPDHT